MVVTVSSINIYPVKSLGGIPLQSALLELAGFKYDRQWMVVKPDGSFLTQRTHPQMALIHTAIEENHLMLGSFGMDAHKVPLLNQDMAQLKSAVWGDVVDAIDVGDETAHWLSQAIGDSCRLVVFPGDRSRICDPAFSSTGDHTRFADGFPLLILSEASLQDLNGKLSTTVSMDRFRPNIVVRGCEAFAEDRWNSILINNLPVRVVKPCARCSIPTVDIDAGVLSGPEPIHTLSSYRRRDGEVYFGMNAVPDQTGEIKVGDEVVLR